MTVSCIRIWPFCANYLTQTRVSTLCISMARILCATVMLLKLVPGRSTANPGIMYFGVMSELATIHSVTQGQ